MPKEIAMMDVHACNLGPKNIQTICNFSTLDEWTLYINDQDSITS